MDLAFGSNVREHFYNIGRLSGLEADSLTRAVRSILVSADGAQADAAQRRPFAAVQAEHMDGDIELRDGAKVIVKAKADFYAPMGRFSLMIESVKAAGEGDLFQKFKELQAKLKAERLFEDALTRPLPEFPKVVAFVTSEIGAVWHDFTEVLRTRGWSGTAWLVPARVQGDTCPGSVAHGLRLANDIPGIDLIVVGRGGGEGGVAAGPAGRSGFRRHVATFFGGACSGRV